MLSNLRNLGMAAEDGPWFSGRSVLLGSMLRPPRHRRWPHRGRSLLLANPPRTALGGQPSAPARRLIGTPPPRRAPSAAHGLYLHTVASCARRPAVYHSGVVRRPTVCGVVCGTYNT